MDEFVVGAMAFHTPVAGAMPFTAQLLATG
jgi:hypothetical protein